MSACRYAPDLYWLDAGWVGASPQHLPLGDWASAHRKLDPQQLWVNRDGVVVEDYLTPENPPPASVLDVGLGLRPKPWEVCMTLGSQWAYKPDDSYKTTETIIHTLASIVATGGNLLLDVGPMSTGELPPTALERLADTGRWMDLNGAAIHDTMPQSPFATNVTIPGGGGVPTWTLASPASAGKSAACAEAGRNFQAGLDDCQRACAGLEGCNTINYNDGACIVKACDPTPGQPLVTKDGGYDVYTCKGCGVAATQWRLTRNGDTVFAMMLLDGAALPNTTPLTLPFVVPVSGGVDGSWPTGALESVTLLGTQATIAFTWGVSTGLELHTAPGGPAGPPYAAVFALAYGH